MADPKKKSASPAASSPRPSPGPSNRGAKAGAESVGYVAVVLVVLVLLNVAGYFVHFRSDWTEANRYSLSQGSENLVSDLDEQMEITAYFTPDLPQPYNTIEPYVRNLLEEYEAASNGRVTVRFVEPDEDDEKEAAEADGVQELQHPGYENDSVTVKVGYRGLAIHYLGNRETIPVIQDTQGLEYEISQAIRRLVRDPLPIGIVSGHGSPTTTEGLTTLRTEAEHYEIREVDLSGEIDDELRALLLINPTEALSETELRRINQYVMNGGSLGVFGGTMNVTLEGMPSATHVDTGVNTLLSGWGIEIEDSLVADARCGRVPLRTQFGLQIPVAYPPAPIVIFDETQREHTVLFRLNQAPFFFTSPITTTARFDELDGTVLARTSENSWLLEGSPIQLQPRDPREWVLGETEPRKVLVALSGRLPSAFPNAAVGEGETAVQAPERSTRDVRVLVAGSGAMLRDEFLPSRERTQGQMTEGLAFVLNAVDWLAADADLIAIRAKNIEDPAIDVPQDVRQAQEDFQEAVQEAAATGDESGVEAAVAEHETAMEGWETKKLVYRVLLVAGLPLLVIVFGLLRWSMRRSKRNNLQELRRKLLAKKD